VGVGWSVFVAWWLLGVECGVWGVGVGAGVDADSDDSGESKYIIDPGEAAAVGAPGEKGGTATAAGADPGLGRELALIRSI
jgi:hypothetical protein